MGGVFIDVLGTSHAAVADGPIQVYEWGLFDAMNGTKSGFIVASLVFAAVTSADASELVYKPINPNFGGNPFNDGILLGTANAQNKYGPDRDEVDPTQQFIRSLQSRLFSGLARQIEDSIFGDDPQDSGSFSVGDQTVSFERGLEFTTIEILNGADGSSTVIEVPNIEVEGGS